MVDSKFFEEQSEQSRIKSLIVSKYFTAWAKIIIGSLIRSNGKYGNSIAYVDLFAGPGKYKDDSDSTPLLVLKKAIEDYEIRNRLITIFNDKIESFVNSLRDSINKIPNLEKLKYTPEIHNEEIGSKIEKLLESRKGIPTLCFVDPWGYKGLSLNLIQTVLADWGSDCVFFFNYNRINAGLSNPLVVEHMDNIFGKNHSKILREQLEDLNPKDRELKIVDELTIVLKSNAGKYVLPFCFKENRRRRTSHHLIFISKHVLGYEIMKEIMASFSSIKDQGVPSFEYSPADERFPFLFEFTRPLDDLQDMLLNEFSGKSRTMKQIYNAHHVDKPYLKKNYKDALNALEEKSLISAYPPMKERRKLKGKPTFGNNVVVTFPKREA